MLAALGPDPAVHPPPPPCSGGEEDDEEEDLSGNKIVQFCKSLMSFTDTYDGDKFFTVQVRRRRARGPEPPAQRSLGPSSTRPPGTHRRTPRL